MNAAFRTVRRLLGQPDFVVAVILLGTAAATLNFATGFLQLHFKKRPVPMRVAAFDAPDGFPAVLGPWLQVTRDTPLDADTEHILGTNQYVNRVYVDTRVLDPQQLEALKADTGSGRAAELARIQRESPQAVISLGLYYYTGLVDTVAHIPDRCYIADGYDVSSYQTKADQKFGTYPDGTDRVVSFRYINFEDQTGQRRESKNVAYLFHVNGHYESDPLGVRRSLQNLFERYGYYAKMELMTVSPSHADDPAAQQAAQETSVVAVEDFLGRALPQFERCMPDWAQVHAGGGK